MGNDLTTLEERLELYANANYENEAGEAGKGNDNWLRNMCRDAVDALREKDAEIARLKALARELNDGMCINCNRAPCRCPTEAT